MALETKSKKCGYHLQKSNFKVQDKTKSVWQKMQIDTFEWSQF